MHHSDVSNVSTLIVAIHWFLNWNNRCHYTTKYCNCTYLTFVWQSKLYPAGEKKL